MFKKLFGGKNKPINDGKSASSGEVDETSLVKNFILQLSNMEGSPTYKLTHQLTVGSEVGNIIIADPSVSSRHCTFILQEEVVSVLDHGSVAGTFINGQIIPPGRYIILEETDNIRIGDLEVQIHSKNESVAKAQTGEEEAEEIIEEVEEESEPTRTSFLKSFLKSKNTKIEENEIEERNNYRKLHKKEPFREERKSKNKALASAINSLYAANTLVRVLAVLCDIIIAYACYIILAPFDEFRHFVSDVPGVLSGLVEVDWAGMWLAFNEDYAFIGEFLNDVFNLFSVTFHLGAIFILFCAIRIVTTLLFGVSISEAFFGMRSHGNAIWKRIGGVLRVLLGIITGPLIIFDLTAIVSRRTFKEILTFTHTYVVSKFYTILGVILYLPLLVGISLLAPLIQGLELPEPIAVSDKLERRVKVATPADAAQVTTEKAVSTFLHFKMDYDPKTVAIIPFFKFTEIKKKISYRPSITLYHKDLQRSVRLEVFKTFDFKELLSIGIKGDFILAEKFGQIDEFVHSEGLKKAVLKSKNDEIESRKFADEVLSFTKIAFELSAENSFETMEVYTPYLKGLIDYKASFLGLIEYKKMDQIDFVKIGNAFFLRISYKGQKPFDLIIPLIKDEGRIFKIEFDKKEDLAVLRNKLYKFTLDQTNWFLDREVAEENETLKPMQVVDFFAKLDLKGDKVDPDKAQALYGYYYEKSAEVLKNNDPAEYEIWKKAVASIFMIMQNMKESIPEAVVAPAPIVTEPVATEAVIDPRLKLFQNFQDLKDAVDNKNNEYFSIEESVKI